MAGLNSMCIFNFIKMFLRKEDIVVALVFNSRSDTPQFGDFSSFSEPHFTARE